ncbi:MAG: ABC transporter permease subunit [Moraxella sp.]|nr:ABC transporter permease subunit [Moraxella sp.]
MPTLFLILGLNFVIVHLAPTSPIHTELAKIHTEQTALSQSMGSVGGFRYQGADGVSDEMMAQLSVRFGFDKPMHERFFMMVKNYMSFELGKSFFKGQTVLSLIKEKLPMSMMFGLLCLCVIYGMGVGLGVAKAYHDGRAFDKITTVLLALMYAVPSFVVGVGLLVLFAGGRFWQIFPMQVSLQMEGLSFLHKISMAVYELFLPVMASSLSGVAGVAYLSKFSLLHEKNQPYVKLLKAQGFGGRQMLGQGLLKNALLPVMSEMPMAVVGLMFFGNFIMEVIFGMDGVGRLAYEAMMSKDYPVMFGLLYVLTLLAMVVQLVFDVWYRLLDPRVRY